MYSALNTHDDDDDDNNNERSSPTINNHVADSFNDDRSIPTVVALTETALDKDHDTTRLNGSHYRQKQHDENDNEAAAQSTQSTQQQQQKQQYENVVVHEDDEDDEYSEKLVFVPLEVDDGDGKALGKDGLSSSSSAGVVVAVSSPGSWRTCIEERFYPPNVPRSCQLMLLENIAVPACYLLVGLLQGLSSPLTNALPVDLGATEAQQTTVSSIRGLPSSFKLLFGFLSDTVPVAGYRRKPYMLAGWVLCSASVFMLLAGSNLLSMKPAGTGCFRSDTAEDDDDPFHEYTVPEDAPSIPFLSVSLLGFGTGMWLADVMGDSIVAEKAKLEPAATRGSIQATCYSFRFFGMMLAGPVSTYLYSTAGPAAVLLCMCCLPLLILPAVWCLREQKDAVVPSPAEQCTEIWKTVCSRAVWQPMGFVYLYNIMQVGNSAWREYLKTVLHFTSCQLNLMLITAHVLLYLGIVTYKNYFITWSWRKVYIIATCFNGVFSVLQVLLVYGITFGLSSFVFALGDDAFAEFVAGIQFLPTTIMMVHLCPAGSEGASYAMFTTVHNSALMLSSAASTQLLRIWDVSKATLQTGDVSGILRLTYLTSAVQLAALVFVGLLPRYKEDLVQLQKSTMSSRFGGAVFLAITLGSVGYAIAIGVLNVIAPGWMGES